jgi:diadenosine tetraphosphatase ApaH/serine/threonine PP2A family protein phosphatase
MADSLIAVFSDIHSNLEAFQAVMADMDSVGVSLRVCLGDIVGYSANPNRCLEVVRSLGCLVIKGNHDAYAGNDDDLDQMNDAARSGIEFSRRKLSHEQRSYLTDLPLVATIGDCEFVHASLEEPQAWVYVTGEQDAREHFKAQTQPFCFCGHTHGPYVWNQKTEGKITGCRGKGRIKLPTDGKTLINVGSVGQPRDLCPEACYVIFRPESREVEFRRMPYDVQKARRKIVRAKLPRYLAQRLSLGR